MLLLCFTKIQTVLICWKVFVYQGFLTHAYICPRLVSFVFIFLLIVEKRFYQMCFGVCFFVVFFFLFDIELVICYDRIIILIIILSSVMFDWYLTSLDVFFTSLGLPTFTFCWSFIKHMLCAWVILGTFVLTWAYDYLCSIFDCSHGVI